MRSSGSHVVLRKKSEFKINNITLVSLRAALVGPLTEQE